MSHRIERGQEYLACADRDNIRIRVIENPVPGAFGDGKVRIVSVTGRGREVRPRYIATAALHDDPARRSGYRLVRNADGSVAEGAQQ